MVKAVYASALFGLIAFATGTLPAYAQESGLAGMHDWRREGGRTCMSEHTHEGTGSGNTKNNAMKAAIRAWAGFTSWEYGNRWGSYNRAASKTASCYKTGSGYSCTVQARPCKSR